MAEQFTFTFEDSIDMSRSVDLAKAFASLLDQLGPSGRVEYSELIGHSALPKSSAAVRKQQLREFIEENPSLLERVPGFMPTADTLLDLIESEMGPISEENLVRANRLCRDKVTAIARPMMERFIREGLGSCLDESCDVVTVPVAELIQFLIGDFSEHLKASGNGLVSVAGQLNEKLLQRALQSAGLVEGTDYSVT